MANYFQLVGNYLKPDGSPHSGFITITPVPVSVQDTAEGAVVTLQSVRVDLDGDGGVNVELLDPNDPGLTPGGATGNPWPYCIRESLQGSAILGWDLMPQNITGTVVDLGTVPRENLTVVRPADWFPHHFIDSAVQAGRISPSVTVLDS
jgi:hypothetical protein